MQQPLVTIAEVAAWLRLSRNRAYIMSREPWFPRRHLFGRLRFDLDEVRAAVRKRYYAPPRHGHHPSPHAALANTSEAARALGVSIRTIRRAMRRGLLGHYRFGRPLIPIEEIQRVRARGSGPDPTVPT